MVLKQLLGMVGMALHCKGGKAQKGYAPRENKTLLQSVVSQLDHHRWNCQYVQLVGHGSVISTKTLNNSISKEILQTAFGVAI